MSCPSDMGNSICILINILLGSFQLFLHSDQPLSEGKIIRSSVNLPVEAALSAGERGSFTH